jgi:hypothetical protein
MKRVAEDTPRPIREIVPETPQWLCDIISRLHAKKPDDRFQSARELADWLERCLEDLKRPGGVPRLPEPAVRRLWSRVPRWAVAGVAILLLLGTCALMEATGFTNIVRGTGIRLLSPADTLHYQIPDEKIPEARPKTKFEALTQAVEDAALTFDGKPVTVPEPALNVIADIDITKIADDSLTGFASVVDKETSGLGFEAQMGQLTGFYKKAGGHTLFLSKNGRSGIGFPAEKPEYVIFVPASGEKPTVLTPLEVPGGHGVVGGSPGTYAVPFKE